MELFEAAPPAGLAPRYNISPSQDILVVRGRSFYPPREMVMIRWGLIPPWSKDPGNGLINARAETAAVKPAFRTAFRQRRCLIPADGFYEWRKEGREKRPFFFRRADRRPLALAGLWETRPDPGRTPLETCAILTVEANATLAPFHDRMPVILESPGWASWLDPAFGKESEWTAFLKPYPDGLLEALAVNPKINNPAFQAPEGLASLGLPP